MRKFIIIIAIISCYSCRNNEKYAINIEYLKTDWVVKDSTFMCIDDSLVVFLDYYLDDIPIYKYTVSGDTLFLRPTRAHDQKEDYKATFKIIELTKSNFNIKLISSSIEQLHYRVGKSIFFLNDTLIKNSCNLNGMEFSSTSFWGMFPSVDMKITSDSILHYINYRNQKVLYQHKLTTVEYKRIKQKLNKVDLNSLLSRPPAPDASFCSLMIKENDSIFFSKQSIRESTDYNFYILLTHLTHLDKLIRLEKSKKTTLDIHSTFNKEWYKR